MGARRAWRDLCRLAIGIGILTSPARALVSAPVVGGDAAPEYQVKAAFIVNFPKFVEWPGTRMPAPGEPFVIAVLGSDPFGPFLREATVRKAVAGHHIEIRTAASPREAAGAHVVYIAGSERPRLAGILRELEPGAALTVSDADGFGAAGVMVNLYLDQRRVRFEVNQSAATRAGLRLSAQLLGIARIVGGGV